MKALLLLLILVVLLGLAARAVYRRIDWHDDEAPHGPDDDPDFLAELDRRRRSDD